MPAPATRAPEQASLPFAASACTPDGDELLLTVERVLTLVPPAGAAELETIDPFAAEPTRALGTAGAAGAARPLGPGPSLFERMAMLARGVAREAREADGPPMPHLYRGRDIRSSTPPAPPERSAGGSRPASSRPLPPSHCRSSPRTPGWGGLFAMGWRRRGRSVSAIAPGGAKCEALPMSGLLLAVALAAAQPAPAPAEPAPAPAPAPRLPLHVTFARAMVGPWEVEARSLVDDSTRLPLLAGMECEMKRSGISLRTWPDGGLRLRIESGLDPDLDFEEADLRAIALDRAIWEYRWIDSSATNDHFIDVVYPPPPPPPDPCGGRRGHDIILYGCPQTVRSGYTIVRRPGGPSLPPDTLANELLGTRMLRIGFLDRDREEGAEGPLLWAEVPLAGLAEARAWCVQAFASDRARLFHGGLPE